MNRYYIPASEWGEILHLTADEAKHCARVMRAREGDKVEIFDGEGQSAVCEIQSISRDDVACAILSTQEQPRADYPITLCQSIPKGGNMELIVQKSVELGVHHIQPLITKHTIARADDSEKKRLKWQRIALEACKQCGQNFLPQVAPVLTLKNWLQQSPNYTTALVAALDDKAVHLKSLLSKNGEKPPLGDIALLVGPEGDLSPEEYQAAYDAGFQPISFGPLVMRVETATLYGLSVLQHELR